MPCIFSVAKILHVPDVKVYRVLKSALQYDIEKDERCISRWYLQLNEHFYSSLTVTSRKKHTKIFLLLSEYVL